MSGKASLFMVDEFADTKLIMLNYTYGYRVSFRIKERGQYEG